MAIDSFIIKYNQIRTFIQSTEDYIIYGAGSNGQKIADYLQNYSAKLIAFCLSRREFR